MMRIDILPGVRVYNPMVFGDARGWLLESWRADRHSDLPPFMQDTVSQSSRGVLRGLHFQRKPYAQGKFVQVLSGSIWDVAVDLRPRSSTYGRWMGEELSDQNHRQLYLPPGIAHGFVTFTDKTVVLYKSTVGYAPDAQVTLAWDDPIVGVEWPIAHPLVSEKDQRGLSFNDLSL